MKDIKELDFNYGLEQYVTSLCKHSQFMLYLSIL
jgi:hypothetical protein